MDAVSTKNPTASNEDKYSRGVGELTWRPWHGWTDDATVRVDGRLVRADGETVAAIDIASYGDDCCVTVPDAAAEVAWSAGGVHLDTRVDVHGAPTLIVPTDTLNTELIDEALSRFNP